VLVGRRRKIRIGFAALLVCAASIAQANPMGAQASGVRARISVRNGVTQPTFSYRDAIRETIYIQSTIDDDAKPGKDLLATDIIRPRETSAGLRVPVIYEMSPYYQVLGRGNESETKQEEDGDYVPEKFPLFYDNYFVPRGYAVLLQDMPGTRNSEGCMVLGGNAELAAAKATLRWLTGRGKAFRFDELGQRHEVTADWSTGKVGMIGKSYDGTIANAAASMGLPGLKTIVPISAISRWYDYHLNNGAQYFNAFITPGLFVFAIDQTPADDEERTAEWVEATFGESAECEARGTAIVAEAGDPRADYTAFWDERDYLNDRQPLPENVLYPSNAGRVRASVFVAHGINDFNVKPNHFVQWWQALARNGVPRKIWLSQTGHVDPFDFRRDKWVRTLHRWFDRWLHGIHNGIMSEPVADIERKADEWRTYATWPAANARRVSLWFGPSQGRRPGVLGLTRAGDEQQSYTDDPNQGEREMSGHRFRTKPHRLLFLTERLERDVRVSGKVPVRLSASVDQADTNFTALLVDYGKATRLDHEGSGEGVRTTERESCHGLSTAEDDACYFITKKVTHTSRREIVSRAWLDARHRNTLREGSFLEPGEGYLFEWSIFGEDYVFQQGHRIGIVIAGSDADWTVSDPSGAEVTVHLGGSRVLLPIVGGADQLRN
jgi:X-Pro dipeptidyl-peptidase